MKTKLLLLMSIGFSMTLFSQEPGSGNTLDFDGINDYIDASANAWYPNDQLDDYTYEAWINMDNVTSLQGVVNYAWDLNTSEPHSGLWITGGQLQTRQRNQNTGTYFVNMSGGTITVGQWTHVALTKVGNTYTIYVNGVSVNSSTVASIPGVFTGRNKFTIGSLWNSSSFQGPLNGNIDEVRIWKTGLTEAELRDWMCQKVTNTHPQYTDLAHYYKLDEGTGTAVADETGTNNATTHANFGPMPAWEVSGAPIGDSSANQYGSGNTITVTQAHADGSSFTIDGFTGAPIGAHVYLVNDTMNSTTNTLSGDLEQTRYYGTFVVGGTAPTYSASYDYSGNTNIDGITTESETRLTKRADNSVTSWTLGSNELDLSIASNSINVCGQSGNSEYAAGFDNTSLPQRAGSGYALDFNTSSSQSVNIPSTSALAFGTGDFTIEGWVNISNGPNTYGHILMIGTNQSNFTFKYDESLQRIYIYGRNGLYNSYSTSTAIFNFNEWMHVALARRSGVAEFYINGNLVDTYSDPDFASQNFTSNTGYIGWGYANEYSDMKTDEYRVWKTAISQSDMRSWMCKKVTSSHPNYCDLSLYYRFDENSGSTLRDYANGVNGTLANSPSYELSQAPLGDESTYSYGDGNSTSITEAHADGSNFTIDAFSGNPLGAHVYLVNDTMNSNTNALSGDLEQTRYYGTFVVGGTAPTYSATYDYSGNTNIDGITTESETRLTKRADNSVTGWTLGSNELDLSIASNSINICGQSGNSEYAAGFNNSILPQRPGSGYAMILDGINDRASVPRIDFSGLSAMTLEAWIKPTNLKGKYYMEITRQGIVPPDWIFSFQDSGRILSFGLRTTTGYNELDAVSDPDYFLDGNWHHVSAVYDGANKYVFVDGVQIGTQAKTGTILYNSSAGHTLGSVPSSGEYFEGEMDEFRFWKEGLSLATIRNWMCKKVTSDHPSYCGMQAYYRCDNNTGTTLLDYKGGANGTLQSGASFTLSGAAIGDESSHDYGNGNTTSVTQAHADGSNFNIDGFSGMPDGAHVYLVNDTMNSTINTLSGDLEQTRYYGTFIVGATSPTYAATYNYSGNINLDGVSNENEIRIVKRADNSATTWSASSNAINLNQSANSVTICGQSSNSEYATGFDNTASTLQQRPGSGYALSFSGSNHITVPQSSELNLTSFTVSAWIKTTQPNASYRRIVTKPNGGGQNYSLAVHNGKAHVRFDNGAGRQAESSTNVNDGKWHYLTGTFDGATNTLSLYLNGVLQQSVNTGTNPPTSGSEGIFIGRFSNGTSSNYIGLIDEVTILNKAISESEIRDWMCKKTTSSHPSYCNIVSYYRFDENMGTTLFDYKGANNGTLMNSPTYELSGAPVGDESVHTYTVTTGSPAIGYSTANGDSMAVNLTAGTADAIHLYYVNEAPNATTAPAGFSNLSGFGHWGVKLFGSTGGTYEVEYNYDGHPLIFNEDSLGLASRDDNADATWLKEMTAVLNTTANTLTLGGQTGTQFILGGGAVNPLPIELLEFNATLVGKTVRLDWKTASELNNDYFTIERSADGVNFTPFQIIKSQGNSNTIQAYQGFDMKPISGINFYRLKQTDYNGANSFSPVRTVTLFGKADVIVYPNPTNGIVHINGNEGAQISDILLTNIEGRTIKQFSGLQGNTFDLTIQQQGVFFLHIQFDNGSMKVVRVVKQ